MIRRSLDELNNSVDVLGNLVVSNTVPSLLLDDTSGTVGIKIS